MMEKFRGIIIRLFFLVLGYWLSVPDSFGSNWSLGLDLTLQSSLHDPTSSEYRAGSELFLTPSVVLAPGWTWVAQAAVSRDFVDAQTFDYADPSMAIRYIGLKFNPYLSLSPALGGRIGLSKDSIVQNSFLWSVRFQPRLALDLSRKIAGLSLFYQASFARNFFEYRTNTLGNSNIAYSWMNQLHFQYSPLTRILLSADLFRGVGWTFLGAPQNSYQMAEQLTYVASDSVAFSLGHATEGAAYKENGIDSNIKFFDGENSTVYWTCSISI